MANAKKKMALVLLGIFLLVKLSPAYCCSQFWPVLQRDGSVLATAALRANNNPVFLLRLDKCIISIDSINSVPKIKYAGTIFSLISNSSFLLVSGKLMSGRIQKAIMLPAGKYIALSVLRI